MASIDSVDSVVARLMEAGQVPDLVVFSAGYLSQGSLLERADADMRQEVEANYLGFVRVCQALASHKPARARMRLVAVGSTVAYLGCPSIDTYSASKAALINFARAARGELGRIGIRISILSPPHMDRSSARLVGPEVHSVDWAAERLCRAIARGRREHTLGGSNRFLIGLSRVAPGLAQAMMNTVGMRSLAALNTR